MTDDEKKKRQRADGIRLGLAAFSGLPAGFAVLAVAALVSTAVRPQVSPVVEVGDAAIGAAPPAVKDWAIQHFGTDDKLISQLGILAVLTLFALASGMLALPFRRAVARVAWAQRCGIDRASSAWTTGPGRKPGSSPSTRPKPGADGWHSVVVTVD